MKQITVLSFLLFFASFTWAQESTGHKMIVFSGSDWCSPCIRLKSETLDNDQVINFFEKNKIEIYTADFPRKKANKPSKETIKQNEELAELYNQDGAFPRLIVLDENNNTVYSKSGFIAKEILMKDLSRIISK